MWGVALIMLIPFFYKFRFLLEKKIIYYYYNKDIHKIQDATTCKETIDKYKDL